jgi:hypothetical protein
MNERSALQLFWPSITAMALFVVAFPLWVMLGGTLAGLVWGKGWIWPQDNGLLVAIDVFAHPGDPWSGWPTPDGPPAPVLWLLVLVVAAGGGYLLGCAAKFGQDHLIATRPGFATARDVQRTLSADAARRAAGQIRPDLTTKEKTP